MDTTDVEVITFKVRGQHVAPAELLRKKSSGKRALPEETAVPPPVAAAPSPLAATPSGAARRKPGSALRDRTNITSDSKTTIKARKLVSEDSAPVPITGAPELKRRRVVCASLFSINCRVDGNYHKFLYCRA
jgi:hypothetical protein